MAVTVNLQGRGGSSGKRWLKGRPANCCVRHDELQGLGRGQRCILTPKKKCWPGIANMSLVEHVENSAERDLGAFFWEEITS